MYGSIEIRSEDQIAANIRNHVVVNTELTDLLPGDPLNQLIVGFAKEGEVVYFQCGKILTLFDIRNCKGGDLELRLPDFDTALEGPQFATGTGVFTRANAVGTVLALPAGTVVGSLAGSTYVTATPTSIGIGATVSGEVSIIAKIAGSAGNAIIGAVNLVVTSFSGPEAEGLVFSNGAPVQNGRDQERDQDAIARVQSQMRSLNATAPDALKGAASKVSMPDGTKVRTVEHYEDLYTAGLVELFVDNGTGKTESTAMAGNGSAGGGEVLVASATSGQFRFRVQSPPIRMNYAGDGLPMIKVFRKPVAGGYTELVKNVDYRVKTGTGEIQLATGLTGGDYLEAHYTHLTGLLQRVQWTLDGRGSDPDTYPGGAASGANLVVRAPIVFKTSIAAQVVVKTGYDAAVIKVAVVNALLVYINSLGIGEDIVLASLYDVAMSVDGVQDFLVTTPAPADPASNIVVAYDHIARLTAADITVP